jgi:putative flippase GtrA
LIDMGRQLDSTLAPQTDHPWIPGWLPRVPMIGRPATAMLNDRRVRYILAGGVSSVTYYAIFAAGWLLFPQQLSYLIVMIVANLLTATVTYPLYRIGVHQVAGPWLRGFGRFYLTCLWALLFGLLGLPLLVEVAGLPVLLAQVIVIIIWPVLNYQLQKYWVFKRT